MEEILTQIGELSPVLVLGLGLSIGLQHAFEPDHVAAVGTQVSKGKFMQKSTGQVIRSGTLRSSLLGAFWGAGHTTTLVLMGLLVYTLAIKIEQNVFSGLELVVGMMLIFLAITTMSNKKIIQLNHRHPHQHQDGSTHYDAHNHDDVDHKHTHKSYLIGCIHGLAGSGSLVVLTAATLNNVGMVLGFILIFGIGSVIGMALVSGIMGVPFALSNKATKINKIARYVAGAFSLIIGANIVYQITIVDNLFAL
ncbi:MAG: high frequency lysogenization protein HflD [Thaumarchaeota archaeon]|nr:high frequency lysogenization protein HflD [Nitrososphaerota archaeon]